jgi:hypothetical protein
LFCTLSVLAGLCSREESLLRQFILIDSFSVFLPSFPSDLVYPATDFVFFLRNLVPVLIFAGRRLFCPLARLSAPEAHRQRSALGSYSTFRFAPARPGQIRPRAQVFVAVRVFFARAAACVFSADLAFPLPPGVFSSAVGRRLLSW